MMANNFTKSLSVIKYKYFMRVIEIENKKKLLAFKQEDNFTSVFQ